MESFNQDMQIVIDSSSLVSGLMTADLRSNVTDIRAVHGYSIQAEYTGTPVGTLKLQASNDDPLAGTQNWVDVSDSSVAISSSGTYLYNVEAAFYGWVRLFYTFTSGTGTLTAKIVLKGI